MRDEQLKKYYEILEIENDASLEKIRQAYRDLALVWHPDRFNNNSRLKEKAEQKFKEINEAYKVLINFKNEPPTHSGNNYSHKQYSDKTKYENNSTSQRNDDNKVFHDEKEIGLFLFAWQYVAVGVPFGGLIFMYLFGLPPPLSGILGGIIGLLIAVLRKK